MTDNDLTCHLSSGFRFKYLFIYVTSSCALFILNPKRWDKNWITKNLHLCFHCSKIDTDRLTGCKLFSYLKKELSKWLNDKAISLIVFVYLKKKKKKSLLWRCTVSTDKTQRCAALIVFFHRKCFSVMNRHSGSRSGSSGVCVRRAELSSMCHRGRTESLLCLRVIHPRREPAFACTSESTALDLSDVVASAVQCDKVNKYNWVKQVDKAGGKQGALSEQRSGELTQVSSVSPRTRRPGDVQADANTVLSDFILLKRYDPSLHLKKTLSTLF